jgi:mono/diheme cytochrome c family protein
MQLGKQIKDHPNPSIERVLRFARLTGLAVILLSCPACQQQMAEQPSYRPLQPSAFFADGASARTLVPGTVARGAARLDRHFYTGERGPAEGGSALSEAGRMSLPVARTALAEKSYVDKFPRPVTEQVLQRGQERFEIYCAVCHGPLGYGDGIVVQRGYTRPPSYHTDRLRSAPAGYFFDVITHGFGSMPDYAEQIPPRDRWAIVAYLRVLQFSQHAPLGELPEHDRKAAVSALESESHEQ